ncbi:hypothetical protein Bca101_061283 [Brassica carinata]
MASPEQSERNSPEKTGSSSVSKKVSEMWERMKEGVPNKRFNFVSKTSTSSPSTRKPANSITEVKDFAGQEIEVKRLVEAGSKEASSSSSAMATSGVDAKLSVLDKTKKDWGEYKEENKGVEDELDKYKKSSDKYLDKVSFLERADYRQFEKERDARLALQSKRKLDDV